MAETPRARRTGAVRMLGALVLLLASAGAAAQRHGETTLWFNQGALAPLGLELADGCGDCADDGKAVADYRAQRFGVVDGDVLHWRRDGARFGALESGRIRHRGGPRLRLAGHGSLDLDGFQLRHRGAARIGLELADARGAAWFTLDHAHAHVGDDGALSLRHMDLRIGEALARRLGRPEWRGLLVGGAQTDGVPGAAREAASAKGDASCPLHWPDASARADVAMLRLAVNWEERQPDGVNSYRCGRSDGTGAHTLACSADSDDGLVVLAPDASLRNVGDAAVAWYAKFSAPAPPYANDQHPYLVWNLYRLDADGRLRQIGASGAKHAFHTINAVCNCGDGNILFPGCEDTYGGFSNDFASGLAPRSEIVPYTARWGRCGSLHDRDCDGRRDAGDGLLPDDAYNPAKRLAVRERELLPARHPGARWFLEYWYVVRDDADPWNNFGLMEITPQKVRGQGTDPNAWVWRFDVTDFRNGSMLQRWLEAAPADGWQRSSLVQTAQGRALLATRVTPQADGRYRYDYQLFNLDLMQARTSGAEPNLRIEENLGIERFAVFADARAQIDRTDFAAVADSGVDWTAARTDDRVSWQRGTAAALAWGLTYRFGFVSDLPPRDSTAHLGTGTQIWHAVTLAPLRDWAPRPRQRP